MGDLLFAVTNLARKVGVDAETALRIANDRFSQRFRHIEVSAEAEARSLGELSLEELDRLWEDAKTAERDAMRSGGTAS